MLYRLIFMFPILIIEFILNEISIYFISFNYLYYNLINYYHFKIYLI
jgi:hypothetical protein